MGRRPGLYAMYKNDKFIAMGTVRELASQCRVSERAIWNKTNKEYQRQHRNGTAVFRIEDEEE